MQKRFTKDYNLDQEQNKLEKTYRHAIEHNIKPNEFQTNSSCSMQRGTKKPAKSST